MTNMTNDEIRFYGKAMIVANDLNASCQGDEAKPFILRLFKEYSDAGKPKDVAGWLRERLTREFKSVNAAPRWIEREPQWPFHEGRPMVFISQASLPRNEITEALLAWGCEVYLFGARIPDPEGFEGYRIVYREVTQELEEEE